VKTLRWLTKNLSTLLLAFLLAVIVWVSAITTTDPTQERAFQPIALEIVGQASDLMIVNEVPTQAVLTIKAPSSIWSQLNNNPALVKAWIDVAGLGAGGHQVAVKTHVDLQPVLVRSVNPETVQIILEPLEHQDFSVELNVLGEPPFGYQKGTPIIEPPVVTVSGPESALAQVERLSTTLNISGSSQTVVASVPVNALDANGVPVPGLTITPKQVTVTQPISILGGYKNLAVKVVTKGQVANGYRLSNISVTPPTVTVFSSDPQQVEALPGYVETVPVDLTGLTDDTEFNTALVLPTGVTLVSEPSVLVYVGVATIEGSLKMTLPVEILGLQPGLDAVLSPPTVDIIVSGPLPVLDTLTPASFRVVVDLTNLSEGSYQIAPQLDLVPNDVLVESILPETVEVIVVVAPTPTPGTTTNLTPTPFPRLAITPTATNKP
jgi:YbbR domain-containing protein